jgi:2-oxo-4-hydroxy-4-carboxy-5-ureidoimidazoline decarboxylase
MAEPHVVLNALGDAAAAQALERCCGSERWVAAMLRARPFASLSALYAHAEQIWSGLGEADQLQAFAQHPQIGEDLAALRERFASTHALAAREQAGMTAADEAILVALRDGNRAYRARFGFIFIVCATGKSAREMLGLLEQRLHRDRATELAQAATEQAKITRLRLESLGANRA